MRDGRLWEIRVHWKLLVLNTNIVRSFAWVTIQTRTPPVQANRSFARKRTIDARTHAPTHPRTHARTHARELLIARTRHPRTNLISIAWRSIRLRHRIYAKHMSDSLSILGVFTSPVGGGGGGREGEDSQYARERSSPPLLLHFGG
jgi:hypothetical protein